MLRARLRGLLVLAYCALSMVGCFALSLPVVLATGKGDLPMWLARRFWSPTRLWLAGCRRVSDALPPLPDGPLLFVANHESAL